MRILLIAFCLFQSLLLQSQDYAESEIRINSFIKGSLLSPGQNKDTLAIVIQDSGSTDRDGNQRTMQNNSIKKLTQELTKQGIATFRYDTRIFSLMRENALVEQKIHLDDFVRDTKDVIDYFRKLGYTSVILIGHGQGALVATLAAEHSEVDKLVCLGAAGQPIDDLIIDQLEIDAPGLVENAKQAFTDLKEKGKSENFSGGLVSIFRPSVQPFMKSWIQYNPAEEIAKLDIPVLIVNGSKDFQVTEKERDILKEAKPDAQFELIENMNHVLKIIEGDELENSKSFNESYRPVSTQLIDVIADFIRN